jgi:hypothetical protein
MTITRTLEAKPATALDKAGDRYALFHRGDSVAGRNIHTALQEVLRLCKDF